MDFYQTDDPKRNCYRLARNKTDKQILHGSDYKVRVETRNMKTGASVKTNMLFVNDSIQLMQRVS